MRTDPDAVAMQAALDALNDSRDEVAVGTGWAKMLPRHDAAIAQLESALAQPDTPPQANAQDERALFEATLEASIKAIVRHPAPELRDRYSNIHTQRLWEAWQAARSAPITALTDEQILHALQSITNEPPARLPPGWKNFARAIERALKGEGK